MNIYKKQYVISDRKLELPYMREIMQFGLYLYLGEDLMLRQINDCNGKIVYLLGNAFSTELDGICIENEIASWDGVDPQKLTYFWTGRWVLIYSNGIIMDPCGLMPAFYIMENDKLWLVSSSLAVISNLLELTTHSTVQNNGISWRIVPGSALLNVNKLLATQKLNLNNGVISIEPQMWIKQYRDYTTEQKCRFIAERLVNACKNINQFSNKKIYLAITGGKDSREVLSAFLSAKISNLRLLTFLYNGIYQCDIKIPKSIAHDYSISYAQICPQKWSKDKNMEYINFSCDNIHDTDEIFYSCGQFDMLNRDVLLIRSGLFEAGQMYARKIEASSIAELKNGLQIRYGVFKDELQEKAFTEWAQWVEEHPIDFIDIRDRFYIEQRVGGWASAIEQSLDLNDFTSIQIANSAAILSVLLSANEYERKNQSLTYGVIKLLEEKLLDYPINKISLFERIKKRFIN